MMRRVSVSFLLFSPIVSTPRVRSGVVRDSSGMADGGLACVGSPWWCCFESHRRRAHGTRSVFGSSLALLSSKRVSPCCRPSRFSPRSLPLLRSAHPAFHTLLWWSMDTLEGECKTDVDRSCPRVKKKVGEEREEEENGSFHAVGPRGSPACIEGGKDERRTAGREEARAILFSSTAVDAEMSWTFLPGAPSTTSTPCSFRFPFHESDVRTGSAA